MTRSAIVMLVVATAAGLAGCGEKHAYTLAVRTPAPVYWGWSQKMPGASCETGEMMTACSLSGYGATGAAGPIPLPYAIAATTFGGRQVQTCSVSPPATPYEPETKAASVVARVVCAKVVETAAP